MKTIAAFFTQPGTDAYPLNEEYYRTAYRELAGLIRERGRRLVIVRSMDSYMGNGRFSRYWTIDLEKDAFYPVEEPINPDLIYNKGKFKADGPLPIINNPEMDWICLDKRSTYDRFPELCPLTKEVSSSQQADEVLKQFSTAMAVAKPIDGEEGRGVIIDKKELLAERIPSYPYLVQEFIDTSGGIPGISDGMHDLRMTMVDGVVSNCFIRVPAKGKLVSNLAQGGSKHEVPIDKLPKEAVALAQKVEEMFRSYGRCIYSVDMGRDVSGRWYIIELNSQPGVTCSREGPLSVNFQNRLADLLTSL